MSIVATLIILAVARIDGADDYKLTAALILTGSALFHLLAAVT